MKVKTGLFLLIVLILLPSCSKYFSINDNPSWMHIDKATKAVSFVLVSGWNGSNNAYNYNGYYAGNVTLKVPDGWNVKVTFINRDSHAPHNIIVTYPYSKDEIPDMLISDAAVIKRAYTEDVYDGEQETMRFIAKEGEYWFFCGISGHGVNDMWINFKVSKQMLIPELELQK